MEGEELIKSLAVPFFVLVLSFLLFFRSRKGVRLPPSPIGLPIIGHLHLLAPIPHQALHKLSKRHGDLIHLRLGSVPCVVASSADAAKELLRTHDLAFSDRPQSKAVSYLTYGSSDFSFAPYGPYWRFMKKLCMSELLGGRTLDLLLPIRREEVVALVQTLYDKSQQEGDHLAIDMGGELIRLTNNVISRMTMSRRCSGSEGESEEIRKLVEEVAELTGKFNVADYIGLCKNLDLQGFDRRLEDVHRRFDGMMERILKEKEEARREMRETEGDVTTNDLLDMLIDISEDASAEVRLTRENIKAFALDVFVAGTDTSAITIEWALAELINRPNIQERAREEIDAVVGRRRLVEESDIPNLPFLQAIVKETLRLHPTGPLIVRQSNKDCRINGYDVAANTTLFVNVWAIGRDPKHWPDPLEFNPERFMGQQSTDVRGQHFELIPFGSGRRVCPGTSLALQLIHSALGAMIQCFEWKVGDDGGGTVDMSEGPGLTLPRAKPLLCTPLPRLNPLPLP